MNCNCQRQLDSKDETIFRLIKIIEKLIHQEPKLREEDSVNSVYAKILE